MVNISELENITCGVPQDPVLGPFYSLFILTIYPISLKRLIFTPADVTNIYYEAESLTNWEP